MRTVHRLLMIIAIVVGSLSAAKNVAAAEVDIIITSASCAGGKVQLGYQATNNSTMSVTIWFGTIILGTLPVNSTATGTLPTQASRLPATTIPIRFTRNDGSSGTTPVTLPLIDCTKVKVYLPLVHR